VFATLSHYILFISLICTQCETPNFTFEFVTISLSNVSLLYRSQALPPPRMWYTHESSTRIYKFLSSINLFLYWLAIRILSTYKSKNNTSLLFWGCNHNYHNCSFGTLFALENNQISCNTILDFVSNHTIIY